MPTAETIPSAIMPMFIEPGASEGGRVDTDSKGSEDENEGQNFIKWEIP